jgi:hypothetical protein
MSTYIANSNGDWWEYHDGDPLFVLKTQDIPEHIELDEIEGDKFEHIIIEYGKQLQIGASND